MGLFCCLTNNNEVIYNQENNQIEVAKLRELTLNLYDYEKKWRRKLLKHDGLERIGGVVDVYGILGMNPMTVTDNKDGFVRFCSAPTKEAMREQFAVDYCLYIRSLIIKHSGSFGGEALGRLIQFLFDDLDALLKKSVRDSFSKPISIKRTKEHGLDVFDVKSVDCKDYITNWIFFVLSLKRVIEAFQSNSQNLRVECQSMAENYQKIMGDTAIDFSQLEGVSDLTDAMQICVKCAHKNCSLPPKRTYVSAV